MSATGVTGAADDLLARRARSFGADAPLLYDQPLHLVRGEGAWIFDVDGKRYLDCYNNVPHVGHAHPRVVAAIAEQTATLTTHSRYLHGTVVDYSEQLLDLFHHRLATVLFTCTGSEANDVALRMAELTTGNRGLIVSDRNYHGNTSTVMRLSAARHQAADVSHVRTFPAPDTYRWDHDDNDEDVTTVVLRAIDDAIDSLQRDGVGVGALLLCPFLSNEGFPELPDGLLATMVERVRAAGGLVIADEIQSGFGRLGTMWGHELAGFRPDVVTLGKAMGNGYPVAALVTTAELMAEFRAGNAYFNTYASNPVAAAAAQATLAVTLEDDLAGNASRVGADLARDLAALADDHPCIGQVRGQGLYLGLEIVADPVSKGPDPERASRIVNQLVTDGVLVGLIGQHRNLIKVRPPLVFDADQADQLVEILASALGDVS